MPSALAATFVTGGSTGWTVGGLIGLVGVMGEIGETGGIAVGAVAVGNGVHGGQSGVVSHGAADTILTAMARANASKATFIVDDCGGWQPSTTTDSFLRSGFAIQFRLIRPFTDVYSLG